MNRRGILLSLATISVCVLLSSCGTPEPGDAVMLPVNPVDGGFDSSGTSGFKINKQQTQQLIAPDSSDDIVPSSAYPHGHPMNQQLQSGAVHQKDNTQSAVPADSVLHAGY